MAERRSLVTRLTTVDHPDPATRLRGRNALLVFYGVLALGIPSLIGLVFIPNGRVLGVIVAVFMLLCWVCTRFVAADVLTRYGGEEFLLVMPQTSLDQARVLCERLRVEVERYPWHEVADGLVLTVSIGVADTVVHDGLVTLVAAADSALHVAKRSGRNRVVLAEGNGLGENHPR